jgi:hypothetical protein
MHAMTNVRLLSKDSTGSDRLSLISGSQPSPDATRLDYPTRGAARIRRFPLVWNPRATVDKKRTKCMSDVREMMDRM